MTSPTHKHISCMAMRLNVCHPMYIPCARLSYSTLSAYFHAYFTLGANVCAMLLAYMYINRHRKSSDWRVACSVAA